MIFTTKKHKEAQTYQIFALLTAFAALRLSYPFNACLPKDLQSKIPNLKF